MVTIGFAGMTHLGLVSACGIASKGVHVLGYDPDAGLIERISAGNLPVVEPQLDEIFLRGRENLSFSSRKGDLADCEVVYIATDVPTDDTGTSDIKAITKLIDSVLPELSPGAILVVLCQVPPGFTRRIQFNPDRLFYQVETLVFGRAVERTLYPERFIVGCAEPTGELPEAYARVLGLFDCPVLQMRYESAELAKISINLFLTASVSVSNSLAELCERIGADWSEIVPALQLDRRIGPYSYLKPGLGISGGNLERDLATFILLAERYATDSSVIRAFVENSSLRKNWAHRVLETEVFASNPEATIGVLGLAYKEDTHSTKNSPSLALLANLRGRNVQVHDPVVRLTALPTGVKVMSEPIQAAEQVDALAVMTPWAAYRDLELEKVARVMRGNVLVDPYGIFNRAEATRCGLVYVTLGVPAYRNVTEHA